MKNFFLILGSLLIAILVVETGSWSVLQLTGSMPNEEYRQIYLRESNNDQGIKNANPNVFKNERVPHPYFGFGLNHGNNYGLPTKSDLPYKRKTGEFVIGIFGGSTARHFAEYLEESKAWENLKLDREKSKVVTLNLALPGGKQPQQFIIGSFFLKNLDMAVVLDGWNEITSPLLSPIEYPEGYDVLFGTKNTDELYFAQKAWRVFNALLCSGPLSKSNTVHIIWRGFKTKFINFSSSNQVAVSSQVSDPTGAERYSEWKKYSTYFNSIANIHGVRVYQFLQPNPYVPEAKPMSREEKSATQFDKMSRLVPKIQEFRKEYLKNKDPKMADLTFLFKEVKEPVYIDSFTHLNERGYSLMAKAIQGKLINERALR